MSGSSHVVMLAFFGRRQNSLNWLFCVILSLIAFMTARLSAVTVTHDDSNEMAKAPTGTAGTALTNVVTAGFEDKQQHSRPLRLAWLDHRVLPKYTLGDADQW